MLVKPALSSRSTASTPVWPPPITATGADLSALIGGRCIARWSATNDPVLGQAGQPGRHARSGADADHQVLGAGDRLAAGGRVEALALDEVDLVDRGVEVDVLDPARWPRPGSACTPRAGSTSNWAFSIANSRPSVTR